MPSQVWNYILLLSAYNGLLLVVVLLRKRNLHNILLAFLVLSISVILAEKGLSQFAITDFFIPHVSLTSFSVLLLISPLFYLYVGTATSTRNGKNQLVHFLPFIIALIIEINLLSDSISDRQNLFSQLLASDKLLIPLSRKILVGVVLIQQFVYLFHARNYLRNHEIRIKSFSSDTDSIRFGWLRKLIVVFALFWFTYFFVFTNLVIFQVYTPWVDLILLLGLALIIQFLSIYALIKPSIFSDIPNLKYKTSSLSKADCEKYLAKLDNLMISEKLYRNSTLKLPDLAESAKMSTNHVSQVLNQYNQSTFFDFVNAYRVQEVMKEINSSSYEKLTLWAIAESAGFRSKSSFNRIFKKLTDLTPTDFAKSCQTTGKDS